MNENRKKLVIRVLSFGLLVPLALIIVGLDVTGIIRNESVIDRIWPLAIVAFGLMMLVLALKQSQAQSTEE